MGAPLVILKSVGLIGKIFLSVIHTTIQTMVCTIESNSLLLQDRSDLLSWNQGSMRFLDMTILRHGGRRIIHRRNCLLDRSLFGSGFKALTATQCPDDQEGNYDPKSEA